MQTASLTGVLETILIIMLFYYGFKMLTRYLFPIFFKKMVNKMEKQAREQQGYQRTEEPVNVGETVIDKKPGQSRVSDKNVGEYVDYEEVDDEN